MRSGPSGFALEDSCLTDSARFLQDLFNAFQRQGEAPPSAAAADLGDEQYVTAHLSDSDMDEVHSLEEYSFESCDEDLASSSPDVAGCPSRVQPLDSTQREPQGSVSSSAEMSAARWRERHLCDTLRRSQEEAREYRKRAEVAEAHAAELQAEAEAMRSLLSVSLSGFTRCKASASNLTTSTSPPTLGTQT